MTLILGMVLPIQVQGVYTWVGTNAAGCDSTATLNLTINNSDVTTSSVTACDSYIWDGVTYTSSGAYTNLYTNALGCDSTHTLNLTINYSTTSTSTETGVILILGMVLPIQVQVLYTWIGTKFNGM